MAKAVTPWLEYHVAGSYAVLVSALLILVAALVTFSQTWAWYGDEGFHLLASQLIAAGKKPYLNFFYPQTPLYAYLNAAWMHFFGQNWRSAHLLSALLTGSSIILAAGFLFERLPEHRWRLSAALIAAMLMGLNTLVIGFGTIGQPYSVCLFLIVAAFLLATKAVARSSAVLLLGSGLCAGAAAASSLLSAPVPLVLLAWTTWRAESAKRLKSCAWYLAGAGIPWLPLAWLVAAGPRQTLFNTFEYHFFHRAPSTWTAIYANFRTFAELFNSGQFALLVAFAIVGMLFVYRRSVWDEERKAEFYLAGWLSVCLGAFLAAVRITFPQYFVLLIPFLSILASVGLISVGLWLGRQTWFVAGMLTLYCAGLPWWLLQQKQRPNWARLEQVANVVNQVTPKDGLIWADEAIYFAARRDPPPGLEFFALQLLQLPPAVAAKLNITSRAELYDLLAKGRIATVATCWATEDWIDSSGIRKAFSERARLNGCDVFWSKAAD